MAKRLLRSVFSKKTAMRLALAFFAFLASIYLFEKILLHLAPRSNGFYQYEPDMGFMVRPGARDSNRFGFNDRDYPLEKPAGRYRIVVLGDSFGWAGGLDGNYTAILEDKFEKHYGSSMQVDVINAGYPMTHTSEQLEVLRKYAIQYDPDLVVLGFFCGNDVYDADPHRKKIVIQDVYVDVDTRVTPGWAGPAPFGAIFLSTLKRCLVHGRERINMAVESLRSDRRELPQQAEASESTGTFSRKAFFQIQRKRLAVFEKDEYRHGRFEDHFRCALESILDMRAFLRSNEVEMVVALYPDEFQVNDRLLASIMDEYGLNQEQYSMDVVQRVVMAHCRANEIPCIDFLPAFRARSGSTNLYKLRDTHWNAEGNELAADILFRQIVPRTDSFLRSN